MEQDLILYIRYMRGCERLGWKALPEEDFLPQYQRLYRCQEVLREYDYKQGDVSFWQQLGNLEERHRVQKMILNVKRTWHELLPLAKAVAAGSGTGTGWNEGEGGAGFPVPPRFDPPSLSGSTARLLPYFDPEPEFRDP